MSEPEAEKPKKPRDWRSLLTELVIVVVGVGLALAAQQAADWLRWRADVAQAREVIATELAASVAAGAVRVRTASCTEHRLDELAQMLDAAAKTGSLPPLGDITIPPRSTWPTGAWDSVVASQTATHFSRQQLADLASAYKIIQRIEMFSGREVEEWETLYAMIGPGRRLDPASEADLRKALSGARYSNRVVIALSHQLAERLGDLHLPFSPADLERIAAARREPAAPNPVCRPVGPVPAFYGQASSSPTDLVPGPRMDKALETLRANARDAQ